MNPISKIHYFPSITLIKLAYNLNCPEIFQNPEKVLGPNYEQVLKLWLLLDELSEEQWRIVKKRFLKWCPYSPPSFGYDNPSWLYYRNISDWIDHKGKFYEYTFRKLSIREILEIPLSENVQMFLKDL
jgi:hypothetical protein